MNKIILTKFFAVWIISLILIFYGLNNSEFVKLGVFVNATAVMMLLLDFLGVKYEESKIEDFIGEEL